MPCVFLHSQYWFLLVYLMNVHKPPFTVSTTMSPSLHGSTFAFLSFLHVIVDCVAGVEGGSGIRLRIASPTILPTVSPKTAADVSAASFAQPVLKASSFSWAAFRAHCIRP